MCAQASAVSAIKGADERGGDRARFSACGLPHGTDRRSSRLTENECLISLFFPGPVPSAPVFSVWIAGERGS